MSAHPSRHSTRRSGFTLVELLVVIGIIAVLMAMLLPALKKARVAAVNANCLSNIRQVAIAMLSYEADNKRLPVHNSEAAYGPGNSGGSADQVARNGQPNHDVRFIYHRYMANVNFLQCPFLPFWDRTEKALPLGSARIYVDYMLIPGFFRDQHNGVLEKKPWVKSSTPLKYEGRRIRVLAADRMIFNQPGTAYQTNHEPKGFPAGITFKPEPIGSPWVGSYYLGRFPSDHALRSATANFAFSDGHAESFNGTDERLEHVIMPNFPAGNTQLLPVR
jgi:prepilin-type N-terminal cleavage/methylation domain-containing protein/prepilin-type processing-associated H-X9-DG protein